MSKPNILLITTDQQRFDTIQALGNQHIYTPHLNWLVDEGVSFTRCYADSPICMSSRATIMTGTHGYTNGLTGNNDNCIPMRDRPTLPGVLTANGYQTRAQGKMHFNPIRANYGFEHMELPLDYYRNLAGGPHVPKGHGVGENEIEPVISTVDEVRSATYWTVDRSIDFMETRDDTRPFFLWTSFAKPHPPFDPSYNYWSLYQNKTLPAPITGDWSADPSTRPQGFYSSAYTLNNGHRMSEEQMMDSKRAYYACITQIDYTLGLLFARMREMGLMENTWIIFTADHGDMMGDHGLFAKSVFLEGSAHIPMIVRPPVANWTHGPLQGKRCHSLVTLADVMPTVLSLAGIEHKGLEMDGRNIMDFVDANAEDRVFYGNCADTFFAVMKDGFKYTWARQGDQELLFDTTNDPMEQQDLSKQKPELAAEMKALLTQKMKQCNPQLVTERNQLSPLPPINSPDDVLKWPGFHSTLYPSDVLH
ncbi:MAG: sulfatase-like hydrolase/transferase [Defluviitaleaceae bacterium]|nr:sulfatase-like hydrolase/transferase [Defluviitaleaceae bacterium]